MLLALFYVLYIPTGGVKVAGTEGNYLYVNKNLVEAAAVFVLLVFNTGRIAGLDLLLGRRRHEGSAAAASDGSRHGGRFMNLTPEQQEQGRRNFLRALAGTPAVAALGAAAIIEGPGAREDRCGWATSAWAGRAGSSSSRPTPLRRGGGGLRHQPPPAPEGRRGAAEGGPPAGASTTWTGRR